MLVASAAVEGLASRLGDSRCLVFMGAPSLLWQPQPNNGLQARRPLLYSMVPGEGSIRQAFFVKERRQPDVRARPYDPGTHTGSRIVSPEPGPGRGQREAAELTPPASWAGPWGPTTSWRRAAAAASAGSRWSPAAATPACRRRWRDRGRPARRTTRRRGP